MYSTPAKRARYSKYPSRPSRAKRSTAVTPSNPRVPRNLNFVKMGKGFPKKLTMTHKYCELNTYGAAGAGTALQYRANGMYDPNSTLTGHQPLYFDQLSAIYDHYTVISSKINVQVWCLDPVHKGIVISLSIDDDTATINADPSYQAEKSSGSSAVIPSDSHDLAPVLRCLWNARAIFGGSILGNDNLQGTGTSDPTEQSFFTICIRPDDLLTAVTVNVRVQIEYTAVWDELKDLAQS